MSARRDRRARLELVVRQLYVIPPTTVGPTTTRMATAGGGDGSMVHWGGAWRSHARHRLGHREANRRILTNKRLLSVSALGFCFDGLIQACPWSSGDFGDEIVDSRVSKSTAASRSPKDSCRRADPNAAAMPPTTYRGSRSDNHHAQTIDGRPGGRPLLPWVVGWLAGRCCHG